MYFSIQHQGNLCVTPKIFTHSGVILGQYILPIDTDKNEAVTHVTILLQVIFTKL